MYVHEGRLKILEWIVLAKNIRTMFLVYMRMNMMKKKAFKVGKC
jgi:hypothetical protein